MSSNDTTNYTTNTTGTNSTGTSPFTGPISPEDIKLIATIFFSLICSLGTIGNFLVILTLVRWREMRTPCNLFIANISFTDLLVSLIMAPLRIIEQNIGGWIFGEVLCYVIAPLQDTLSTSSVLSHTAIAMERYRAIVAPFKPRLNKRKVKITIFLIWVGCYVGMSLPLLFFFKYELRNGVMTCLASEFPKEDRYIFSLYLVVVFILAPLICQVCCYIMVIKILRRKDAIQDHRESTNQITTQIQIQTSNQRVRAKKRLIRMLIVLMLIFQLCYLPRGFIMMIYEFAPSWTRHEVFPYINLSTLLLVYVKHVINPLILYCMSRDFRDGFMGLCMCNTVEDFSLHAVPPGSGKKSTNRTRF